MVIPAPIIDRPTGLFERLELFMAEFTKPAAVTETPPQAQIQNPATQPPNNAKLAQELLQILEGKPRDDSTRQKIEKLLLQQQSRLAQKNGKEPNRSQAMQALLQNPQLDKALRRDLTGRNIQPAAQRQAASEKQNAHKKDLQDLRRGQELASAGELAMAAQNAGQILEKPGAAKTQSMAREAINQVAAEAASRAGPQQSQTGDLGRNLAKTQAREAAKIGGVPNNAATIALALGQFTRA
jgi:hypothetical protein